VGELFDEHGPSILGLCRLILRDPVEAEDAAQQTFLSAHRALLRGTEPHEPAAWLTAIARNECRARIRRRELVVVPREDDAVDRRDASDVAADHEQMKAVAAAIADLPDRQRAAVVLRDLRGLSNSEVAQTLAVEPAAVDALVYRGRQRVRRMLRRSWPATVVVPVSLRDALARLIPHFETSGGAGATLLGAKLLAAPVVKVAAGVAAAVLAVGATAVEIERAIVAPRESTQHATPAAPHVARSARAKVVPVSSHLHLPSASHGHLATAPRHRGRDRGSRDDGDRDRGGRQPEPAETGSSSGPGPTPASSDQDVSVSSGPGSTPAPAPSTQPPRTDNSGPGSLTDSTVQADSSGPSMQAESSSSGPGPGPEPAGTSGSDGSNSGPGSTSSGSDSSGSESSGSDSSGSGSDGHGGSGE
jgi:RNA polymerase sigma-70 factor (ECF subfamily)